MQANAHINKAPVVSQASWSLQSMSMYFFLSVLSLFPFVLVQAGLPLNSLSPLCPFSQEADSSGCFPVSFVSCFTSGFIQEEALVADWKVEGREKPRHFLPLSKPQGQLSISCLPSVSHFLPARPILTPSGSDNTASFLFSFSTS